METDRQSRVSVIIPTKNRSEDLDLTLRSLVAQTVLPEELIIVDQSEGNESRTCTERVLSTRNRGIELKYIHDTRITGGAAARNQAMSVASGNVWLFLDDDVILEADFIEQLLNAYHANPEAVGVSGIVTNYPHPALTFQLWSSAFVRGPFHDDRQPVYWNAERLRKSDPIAVSRMGGGLMSFKADVVRDLRFDENLSGVSDGEDVDFCSRLTQGSLLIIVPKARLVHKLSPAGRSRQHWLNRHARSNHFLYHKNWAGQKSNKFYFAWLNAGYYLVASLAVVKSASLAPWRDLLDGIEQGRLVGTAGDKNRSEESAVHAEETVNF